MNYLSSLRDKFSIIVFINVYLDIFQFPINQVLTLDRVFLELVKDLLHTVLMVLEAVIFQKPPKTVLSINKGSALILEGNILFFASAVFGLTEVLKMPLLFHKYRYLVLQSLPLLLALHVNGLVVDSISVAVCVIDINLHVLAIILAYQWVLIAEIVDCVFLISRPL